MKTSRTYSSSALQAAQLLGEHIRLGRKQQHWSEKELAERAGISRATLQKIERGDMSCAIGLVFEVAVLTGVALFAQEQLPLPTQLEHTRDKTALLPQRIRTKTRKVDDDF